MTTGIVFDIREFTLHDGPGIRTTVFLKGCPLACTWCHNPEGRRRRIEVMRSPAGERIVGRRWESGELAALLRGQVEILRMNGGGVTFSGGEPLAQARFIAEVIDLVPDIHVVLDTSGYGGAAAFRSLVERAHLVHFDLKLADPIEHRRWTGRDNDPILRNLATLGRLGQPFVTRVPLIPGVTDTSANLAAIARLVSGMPGLVRVDLLPYNRAAGGKYEACGMRFDPGFDEDRALNADLGPFRQAGIAVRVG